MKLPKKKWIFKQSAAPTLATLACAANGGRGLAGIKKEHYSNFYTFENASLVNVPGHYLRKYGIYF